MYAILNFGITEAIGLPTLWALEPANFSPDNNEEPISIIFTGDVMLARDVEMRLLSKEKGYSLSSIRDVLVADAVVMNFEAAVPENHIQTQHMEMKFSVRPDLLGELRLQSPIYLSLANNHSLDFGVAGYKNTVKTLEEYGFKVYGHAIAISTSSLSVIEAKGQKVLVLYLNATYGKPDISLVKNLVDSVGPVDLVVTYIHWGTEYEPKNDTAQENLAHQLIDAGFDLVAGHHPHVVQNVEKYKDGLIFYSLGNLIFDQYWTSEVQEGLLIKVVKHSDMWGIELIPVESTTARVQPHEMMGGVKHTFLNKLANRSDPDLASEISSGFISFQSVED